MFPDQEELIFFIGISLFLSLGFRYILKFKKNTTFLLPKEMFTQLNVVSLANGFTYNFSIYGIIFFIYLLSREFTSFLTGYRNQVFTAYDNRNAFVVISIPRVG